MLKSIRMHLFIQSWRLLGFEKSLFIGLKMVFFGEVFLKKVKNSKILFGVFLEFERIFGRSTDSDGGDGRLKRHCETPLPGNRSPGQKCFFDSKIEFLFVIDPWS